LSALRLSARNGATHRAIAFSIAEGERVASVERLTEEYQENGGAE
jgi:hypothetical protein